MEKLGTIYRRSWIVGCVLFCFCSSALPQVQWQVGHGSDTGWVLRKDQNDPTFERFFAIGSFGVPEYVATSTGENYEPDSVDFLVQTQTFNVNFLRQRGLKKTFMKSKPLVSGWTDINYLWHSLHGFYEGLGTFDRTDGRISFEEMQQVNTHPTVFSELFVKPVVQQLKEDFLDSATPYDLIWFLNDEPERSKNNWYWSPSTIKLFDEEVKRNAPTTLTFVDLGPVEGSVFLYDRYLNEVGASLAETLRKRQNFADEESYVDLHATIDGQRLYEWEFFDPAIPDSGCFVTQEIKLTDELLRDQIKATTQAYAPTADIIGINSYYFFNQHPRNVSLTVEAMREAAPGKPLWFFFQAFESQNPGIKALKSQIYTSIIHGVTGVLFYNNDAHSTPYWEEVKKLSEELNINLRIVTSPTVRSNFNGDVKYVIKSVQGRPYIIAVNHGSEPVDLRIQGFPNISLKPLEVIIESATAIVDVLIVNEIMKVNSRISDEDGDYFPWIEIHNPSTDTLHLDGFSLLTDTLSENNGWYLNDIALIPKEYETIWFSGKDRKREIVHTDFQISDSTRYIAIKDRAGITVEVVSIIDRLAENESFGRDPACMFDWVHYPSNLVSKEAPNPRLDFWRKSAHGTAIQPGISGLTSCLVFDKKVWVFSGHDSVHSIVRPRGVWASHDGIKWEIVSIDPPFSSSSSFVVFRNSMWSFGCNGVYSSKDGINWKQESPPGNSFCNVRIFAFKDALWYVDKGKLVRSSDGRNFETVLPEAPWTTAYSSTALIAHNGRMFMIGGSAEYHHRDVWSSEDGIEWHQQTLSAPWEGREGFTAVSFDKKIWVMGGRSQTGTRQDVFNDVWISEDGKEWRGIIFDHVWPARFESLSWVFDGRLWISGGIGRMGGLLGDVWSIGPRKDFDFSNAIIKNLTYGDENIRITGIENFDITSEDPQILEIEGGAFTARATGKVGIKISSSGDKEYYPFEIKDTVLIRPKKLLISIVDTVKVYGDEVPELTLNFDGFEFGDSAADMDSLPRIATDAYKLSHVGIYNTIPVGGASKNYVIERIPGKLEIKPRTVIVTVADTFKTYGEPNPEFVFHYDGLVSIDALSQLKELPEAKTAVDLTSGVGIYKLIPSGGFLPDHSFKYIESTMEVRPKELMAWAVPTSKFYGEPNPKFSLQYEGFILGEGPAELSVEPEIETSVTVTTDIGIYELRLRGGVADNYTLKYRSSFFEVKPRELFVQPVDTFKIFGEPNPAFLLKYKGFVLDDGIASLEEHPIVTTDADEYAPVGIYVAEATGGRSKNYSIISIPAVMEIKPKGEVIVFPNPVVDGLSVSLPQIGEKANVVTIHSLEGDCVLREEYPGNHNEFRLDCSGFPPGIYFYTIINQTKRYDGKFIKE